MPVPSAKVVKAGILKWPMLLIVNSLETPKVAPLPRHDGVRDTSDAGSSVGANIYVVCGRCIIGGIGCAITDGYIVAASNKAIATTTCIIAKSHVVACCCDVSQGVLAYCCIETTSCQILEIL